MRMLALGFLLTLLGVVVADAAQQRDRRKAGKQPGEVITRPARGERHPERLKVGDAAPDFTLSDPSTRKKTTLWSFRGKRPVVLIFGSFT